MESAWGVSEDPYRRGNPWGADSHIGDINFGIKPSDEKKTTPKSAQRQRPKINLQWVPEQIVEHNKARRVKRIEQQ